MAKQELKFVYPSISKLKDLHEHTYKPKFDVADITLENIEKCFNEKPVIRNNNEGYTIFF